MNYLDINKSTFLLTKEWWSRLCSLFIQIHQEKNQRLSPQFIYFSPRLLFQLTASRIFLKEDLVGSFLKAI